MPVGIKSSTIVSNGCYPTPVQQTSASPSVALRPEVCLLMSVVYCWYWRVNTSPQRRFLGPVIFGWTGLVSPCRSHCSLDKGMCNHGDVPFHEDYMVCKHGVEDRKTQIPRTDLGSAFIITGQWSEMLKAVRQVEFKPFKSLVRASLRPPWICFGDCVRVCVCVCFIFMFLLFLRPDATLSPFHCGSWERRIAGVWYLLCVWGWDAVGCLISKTPYHNQSR